MNTLPLAGRSAIVTGGASGIGRAIVQLFLASGAKVGILDLPSALPEAPASDFAKTGGEVAYRACDVTDPAAVEAAVGSIRDQLGAVTILVNCAGIDEVTPFEEITLAQWNRMLAVHLTGTFLVTQAVLPDMRADSWGRVINLSSQLAHRGSPGMLSYCTAKAGIMGFTRSLAYEVSAQNITVNCLNPGPIDTPLVAALPPEATAEIVSQLPLKRLGKVEEVAHTALLLARPEGAYYQGASMNMNGGHYMI